jgi:hypothetical protein
MTRVKRRFMRPQSANKSGFMGSFQGQTFAVSVLQELPDPPSGQSEMAAGGPPVPVVATGTNTV